MWQISIGLLTVATVGVFVTAESVLLGAHVCTWGLTYWCSNLTTSGFCDASEACISKRWSQMNPDSDDSDVCKICKDTVLKARGNSSMVPTGRSHQELFAENCAKLPNTDIVNECNKRASENSTELAKIIASEMNELIVCTITQHCNSPVDNLEQNKTSSRKKRSTDTLLYSYDKTRSDECSGCYMIVDHMEYILNTTTRKDLLNRMINFCQYMSSYSDACSSIVVEHFSTIYSHLRENFKSRNICHLSGQCSQRFHKHDDDGENLQVEISPRSSVGMLDVRDDLPCKLCAQLVGHLRDLLIANTTENEFKLVLDGLCGRTKSFAVECKSIVDEYYGEIYDYLVRDLNQTGICEMAGICPAPDKQYFDHPIVLLLPPQTMDTGVKLMNNLNKNDAGTRGNSEKNEREGKPSCPLCLLAVGQLYNAIKDNKTEASIEHALQKLCNHLPKNLVDECDTLVQNYSEELISTLMNDLTPQDICVRIRLCDPSKDPGPMNLSPIDDFTNEITPRYPKTAKKLPGAPKQDSGECTICQSIMQYLDKALNKDANRNRIKKLVYGVCHLMPESDLQKCDSFIDQWADVVFELLSNDISPREVCTFLKVCQENMQHLQDSVDQCAMCQSIVFTIDDRVGNSTQTSEIVLAASEVCSDLPGAKHMPCKKMMKIYKMSFVNIFGQNADRKTICTRMAMCDKGDFWAMKRGQKFWKKH